MHESLTVRDAMMREFVGVSESDSVVDAAELLLDEGVDTAVVLRGSDPVGLLSPRDALRAVLDNDDPESVPVEAAMRPTGPTVDAWEDLGNAESTLMAEGARELLVIEDGELVGVLGERDIMTVNSAARDVGEESEPEPLRTNGGAEPEPEGEDYATQSICEICGTLVSSPSVVDGQVVCPDCENV